MRSVIQFEQLARQRPYFVALISALNALAIVSLYIIFDKPRHSLTTTPTTTFANALRLSTLDHPNNTWIPLALSSCTFGMPTHYAPCVARTLPNLLYAEELVYPSLS
ncbi:hypothetical protein B0H16DRAFT_1718212 [Mycena metata]|uniref:Uncharacterized protein n=1 Tax=Mycena metata TaxID=1033252 RepID=A0AAD7NKJ6_9AGAR|nr:hypothetical protein B0H16DRAFT_1718212 [Mycena metata]